MEKGTAPKDVDEYMAALPKEARATLQELRATIQAAAPKATETISYKMPAFRAHGRALVYYASFKNHCSLFPAGGTFDPHLSEEMEPYVTGKGTLQFPAGSRLPKTLVKKIVKARLAENAVRERTA